MVIRNFLQNGNKQRLASASVGLLITNLIVAIVVDQLGVPLHPNVVASGSLLLAAITNKLMARYF